MSWTGLMEQGTGWAWRRATTRYPSLTSLRAGLAHARVVTTGGVKPENLVWIFGTGRGGSTWLRTMMCEVRGCKLWEEPLVGKLFGEFYEGAQSGQLKSKNYVLGDPTREGWVKSLRRFVLDGAQYARPLLGPRDYLVVKEPNGSAGAPLLMEALPESRMILLVRDPRDVISSTLDAARRGGWLYEWSDKGVWREQATADEDPDAFVKMRAAMYLQQVGNARKAYNAHKGPKVLVRYEDLRAVPLVTMQRIYSELGIEADYKELIRAVEEHAWEKISGRKKGAGKAYRKATPGSWREELTASQVEVIERITAPLLEQFYVL